MYENRADHENNNLILQEISMLIFFQFYCKKNNHNSTAKKPITNSCRSNLWSKSILILSKTEFKILRKKPGDEVFRVSFKFPRRG